MKGKVRANQYVHSRHAELEREAEELTLIEIEEALLSGAIRWEKAAGTPKHAVTLRHRSGARLRGAANA